MDINKKLRAAVIGCGVISVMHAAAIKALDFVELVACADIDSGRAERFAAQYGGTAYASYEEMLRREKPDVVHICTPHYAHIGMIEAAAKQGTAVFTEKPPVISKAEFARLEKAGAQVPIGVCFQNRFNDSVLEIHRLMKEGKTGKPLGARAFVTWHREECYYAQAPWRGKVKTAMGGSLSNQSIHTLDLLIQFLGSPTFVQASTSNYHLDGIVEVEDTVDAYIGFEGCNALFYSSNAYCKDERVMVDVCFENLTVRMEETDLELRWNNGDTQRLSFAAAGTNGKSYWGTGHNRCIAEYYSCLRQKRPFLANPAGVKATMDATFGIYESAAAHQKIYL